jgi:hypothetical protein
LELVPLQRIKRGIAANVKGNNIINDLDSIARISINRADPPKMSQLEIITHQGILPPDKLLKARPLR